MLRRPPAPTSSGCHAGVGDRVATSDLQRMTATGLLAAVGERRGRFYVAGDELEALRRATREPRRPIPDPFGSGSGAAD